MTDRKKPTGVNMHANDAERAEINEWKGSVKMNQKDAIMLAVRVSDFMLKQVLRSPEALLAVADQEGLLQGLEVKGK